MPSPRRHATPPSPAGPPPAASWSTLFVPVLFVVGLVGLSVLPRVAGNASLQQAFWTAAAVLLTWTGVLAVRYGPEAARFVSVTPRPEHYIQMCCHLGVYGYWGYYWSPVYPYFPLLIAQVCFAYAFDILLSWSRRQPYGMGFGPFPIVFSTNLFLWFRDDWFIFQFLLISTGFLGKAFIRWHRDGRLVHVFNPSAFALALFSLVLIVTGTTSATWAQEINTTFSLGPWMYTVLFLIGLVVMYNFAITPVTAMAAVTLFALSGLYRALTGVPYFVDSEIPTAVFLGLHLLVTDPSTSPRTPLGRAIFGTLYGLGVFALYALLSAIGAPTFYDKLLCVPLLNLLAPSIDRLVAGIGNTGWIRALALDPPLGRHNLKHMAAWIAFFIVMTAAGRTDGMHPGDAVPFWQQACAEERTGACSRLLNIEASYCGDNAGWACNELGRHYAAGELVPADAERARGYFTRACEGRFQAGCLNLLEEGPPLAAEPRALDLRLLLREGGLNLLDMSEPDLYARACRHGWAFACGKTVAER